MATRSNQADLFALAAAEEARGSAPLAARMRPSHLDELVGQEHILKPGSLLRRAIEADRLTSAIFYGPPGSGKTTLARLIAARSRAHFEQLNAVTGGVADIRRVVAEAESRRGIHGVRTLLFVDEIHRFNKAQQDALLPYVEEGLLTLIGATTQNPFIDCNPALVSRSRIFKLEPLGPEQVRAICERALRDAERGLAALRPAVDPEALDHIVAMASGDARAALNALELAVLGVQPGPDGRRRVDLAAAEESIQVRALRYDRGGDQHYDVVSAFIKSIRGSDPDAALYWLARMLAAGEDPRFIARRLVISASEDVGNADPRALPLAVAAVQAVEFIGLPEGRIPLAQATAYLACAPKSNAAYVAIDRALADVEGPEAPTPDVPAHLRDSSYRGAERLGNGRGYLYPHDHPGHHVAQAYLPPELAGRRYYEPSDQGEEATLAARLAAWRARAKP